MTARRVAVLCVGDFQSHTRVQRTVEAMSRVGHSVHIFAPPTRDTVEQRSNCKFEREQVDCDRAYDYHLLSRIMQISPMTAEIVEACDARALHLDGMQSKSNSLAFWEAARAMDCLTHARLINNGDVKFAFDKIRSEIEYSIDLYLSALRFRPNIVYAHNMQSLIAAHMLHVNFGCEIIYDAHYLFATDSLLDAQSPLYYKFYEAFEFEILRVCHLRITSSDHFAKYYADLMNESGFAVIHNTPSVRYLSDRMQQMSRYDKPVVLYHGNLLPSIGLDEFLESIRYVPDVQFVLRGMGEHEMKLRSHADRVQIHDQLRFERAENYDDMMQKASFADIGFVPTVSLPRISACLFPDQSFEYLMAGLSLLAVSETGISNLLNKSNVGDTFPRLDPHEIAHKINILVSKRDLLSDYKFNALRVAKEDFNWENEERKFLKIIAEAI